MSLFFSKIFKIKNLSVSISSHAVLFVWCGRKRIKVKSIRGDIQKFIRVSSVVMSLFLVILVAGLTVYKTSDRRVSVNEDDIQKNQILKSVTTDYIVPHEAKKLEIIEHKVKKGESLAQIAKLYKVSVDTICGSNNLTSYDNVSPGRVLKIPNIDGILYKMRKGISLVDIAKTYRVSLEKILQQNEIKNPDFIASGRMLFIPDAKPKNIFDGFIWPVPGGKITSSFGWRRNPFSLGGDREFHPGIDISVDLGTTVKAAKYGQVTYAGWMGGYGYTVILAHPDGFKSLYAHLSSTIVSIGQYVKQGQVIARSGSTGRSTGPHLHFEVIKNGTQKNPFAYLKR